MTACRYGCPCDCRSGSGRENRASIENHDENENDRDVKAPRTCRTGSRGDRSPWGEVIGDCVHAEGKDAGRPFSHSYDSKHSRGGEPTTTRPRCSCPRTSAIKARSIPRAYALPSGDDLRARVPANVTAPRGSRLGLRCRASAVATRRVCARLVVQRWSARTVAEVRRLITESHGQGARSADVDAARIRAEAMTKFGRRNALEEGGTPRLRRGPRFFAFGNERFDVKEANMHATIEAAP